MSIIERLKEIYTELEPGTMRSDILLVEGRVKDNNLRNSKIMKTKQ